MILSPITPREKKVGIRPQLRLCGANSQNYAAKSHVYPAKNHIPALQNHI